MSPISFSLRGLYAGVLGRRQPPRAPSPSLVRLADPIALARAEDETRVRVRARVVAPDTPLLAPLTQRPCVFWSITIEEWSAARNPLTGWVSRLRDTSVRPFDVEDGTNRASIDVRGMHASSRTDATRKEPLFSRLDPALRELLDRYDSRAAPLRQKGGKLRVREGVFEAGEELFVQGRARWVAVGGEGSDYRSPSRRVLVIGPDEDEPVYASEAEGPY